MHGLSGDEFVGRKAPYAPVSALKEFFERMREVGVPARVDRRFLQKLNVASNNEWALLSALKFLGIVDEGGTPTTAYRLLQTTDRFEPVLCDLVSRSYRDLLDSGGKSMSIEDLQNYFRVTSSPSQAKNAARFFREVLQLSGLFGPNAPAPPESPARLAPSAVEGTRETVAAGATDSMSSPWYLLQARAGLIEKLPAPQPEWTAQEYKDICDRFLAMLEYLTPPH